MNYCNDHGAFYGASSDLCPWCSKGNQSELLNKKFSFSTIEQFDKHVSKSVDGYIELHDAVCKIAEYFIDDNTNVFDIGCSTGTLIKKIDTTVQRNGVKLIGIEPEWNFAKELIPTERINWLHADATIGKVFNNASLITSIFTIQFIQTRKRRDLIKDIYNGLNDGGAFIFAEKIRSDNSFAQDVFTFAYYDFKLKSFSGTQILEKEKDLRYQLKPLTLEDNKKLIFEAGFKTASVFWQRWNFTAMLCIK